MVKFCTKCGAKQDNSNSNFCIKCGAPLEKYDDGMNHSINNVITQICPMCNKSIPINSVTCPFCGNVLNSNNDQIFIIGYILLALLIIFYLIRINYVFTVLMSVGAFVFIVYLALIDKQETFNIHIGIMGVLFIFYILASGFYWF